MVLPRFFLDGRINHEISERAGLIYRGKSLISYLHPSIPVFFYLITFVPFSFSIRYKKLVLSLYHLIVR
jgi:hypothetical protein